jgi:subtilase family serine protease
MKLFALFLAVASASVSHPEGIYANGWAKQAMPASGSTDVKFTIVVKEQGIEEVQRIALDVNDPTSVNYGQFLTQEKLDSLTAPKASDVLAVKSWLNANGIAYSFKSVSNIEVVTSAFKASKLLNTRFHKISNSKHAQSVIRAADYSLPDEVHAATAAIFGLHGLPLPPTQPLVISSSAPGQPAKVDPNVLASTYSIGGVKTTGNIKNRQAVAEFQGQLMSSKDLTTLFKTYVKGYKAGTDDTVFAYKGNAHKEGNGVEAELDIQYIMGPAVGIKTEFWEFAAMDFCNDLNQWTSNLTSSADVPLVHSVSYGWQGNLTQVHCKPADLSVVDANFAKLAAKGISIMISSGDSGSGYSSSNSQCMQPSGGGSSGSALTGTIKSTADARNVNQCCEIAGAAPGWTFAPASETLAAGAPFAFSFKDSPFHTIFEGSKSPVFKTRDVDILNGDLDATGGKVTAKNSNGTFPTATITFGAPKPMSKGSPEYEANVTATIGGTAFTGRSIFLVETGRPAECFNIEWKLTGGEAIWEHGSNPPPPPPPGKCTIFSAVTGKKSAPSSTISGAPAKAAVVLWPSWPASSPWVTSVGATRFVGQKVGNEEMATDQFGSGGGFSKQFAQSPNAEWQSAAVAQYLKTVDASTLPPADSFPAMGRATPDVSALGEGYQVFVNGKAESVGGTSASSPAFAAMVSLLNEARLNAGKPAMGFLNPFLYKNADAFTDVTKGSNKIGRGGNLLPYGFNCSAGWDPATGLGTPKFDKLLAAAMA